jgi:hypothetical protein
MLCKPRGFLAATMFQKDTSEMNSREKQITSKMIKVKV